MVIRSISRRFATILVVLGGCLVTSCQQQSSAVEKVPFSLDELQSRSFDFFWETADSLHYQIPDRWPSQPFSSIAATGFGLTSYLVGVECGYVTREAAADRVLRTLQALWAMRQGPEESGVSGYRGFFYHFLTPDRAERFQRVELSTIDTGLLMAGVLSVQSYFDQELAMERDIRQLADSLYLRVEWDWAMQPGGDMSMGWHPEPNRGFLPASWKGYNEAMVLLIMAMGSPSHPIPDSAWTKWCETYHWEDYYEPHVNFSPLFGHQYSHMYIDFRGIQDEYMRGKGMDYFENSRIATLANQAYCIRNPKGFTGYSHLQWGLSACDGPGHGTTAVIDGKEVNFTGYWARGASALHEHDDGTLTPTAVGGSIPFLPDTCLNTLAHLWNTHYDSLVGEYGFKDAFNLSYPGEWYDFEYLGIDQGPILIMAENHRSELVWNLMKKNPYLRKGLRKAGFQGGWLEASM